MTKLNVTAATTAELIAFYNANTGGNPVKKFADRKTAERRVQALLDEIAAEDEGYGEPQLDAASEDMANMAEECKTAEVLGLQARETVPASKPMAPIGSHFLGNVHSYLCPHCGIDLENGVGEHDQEVNGKHIKHNNFEYMCLGCGGEFGPAIATKKPSISTGKVRPEMTASLKLDRQIREVTSNLIFDNACRVWKAGLVSSAQCDRLSSTLYGEAKKGNRLMSVTINGHVFTLENK